MNYAQVLARLAGRVSRKVGQHTYLRRVGLATTGGPDQGEVGLVFHGGWIITWHKDGRVVLNSFGLRYATTRRRFNQWLPDGITVESERIAVDLPPRFKWTMNGKLFTDGMTIQTGDKE